MALPMRPLKRLANQLFTAINSPLMYLLYELCLEERGEEEKETREESATKEERGPKRTSGSGE